MFISYHIYDNISYKSDVVHKIFSSEVQSDHIKFHIIWNFMSVWFSSIIYDLE